MSVIPRQDYTAGISQSLAGGFVPGLDYRFLHFSSADVHILNPSLEYYFERPIWIAARFYQAWTRFARAAGTTSGQSLLLQYNQQFREFLTLHLGYAYGNESFSAFTADRVGIFSANTVYGSADLKLSEAYTASAFYSWQIRSGGDRLNSFGVSLTIRR